MTGGTAEDWQRVGAAVRARRGSRTQQELATAADISMTALGEIERGERSNFTGRTLAKLSTALRWSSDSIERILRGEEPIETPDDVPDGIGYRQVRTRDRDETVELTERLVDLASELNRRAREGQL